MRASEQAHAFITVTASSSRRLGKRVKAMSPFRAGMIVSKSSIFVRKKAKRTFTATSLSHVRILRIVGYSYLIGG